MEERRRRRERLLEGEFPGDDPSAISFRLAEVSPETLKKRKLEPTSSEERARLIRAALERAANPKQEPLT